MLLMQYSLMQYKAFFRFPNHIPEIESTWPTAKSRGRKSFDTLYYVVTCTTLCVGFSLKSKAINGFSKHVLKSKARDQSI